MVLAGSSTSLSHVVMQSEWKLQLILWRVLRIGGTLQSCPRLTQVGLITTSLCWSIIGYRHLRKGACLWERQPTSVQAVFKTRLTIETICPQPTSSLDKFFLTGWRTGQYIIAPIMFNDKSQYLGLTKFIRSPWGQYTYGETVTLKNSSFSTLYLFVPCQEFQSVLFKTFALVH